MAEGNDGDPVNPVDPDPVDPVDPVDPDPNDGGNQCSGVPIAIPSSCSSQYDCATIQEVYEYT